MQDPWDIAPGLTPERIKRVASLIRSVRDDVIDLHDEELGDTARATGLRAYECCRQQIIWATFDSENWPWLGIIKDDGRFTFSIGGIPVRIYRGSPKSPGKRRQIACPEAHRQMTFLFEDIGESSYIRWLFAIEVDADRYVERITLTGYLNEQQVSSYEVPLNQPVPVLSKVTETLPEPAKLNKAKVSVKKKPNEDSDVQNGNS
ncbi:hypothetical protein L9G16_01025 [Shewanella sp. A25]|nr:hypothetical protein [Shewanella shenzhenensis]